MQTNIIEKIKGIKSGGELIVTSTCCGLADTRTPSLQAMLQEGRLSTVGLFHHPVNM
uniref:Bm1137 n=1 Tax=Brugia malayi TaxID=6279 RepID=A0A1I9G017_BRUMA|nr:Bm1137 [Brugia malayi]